jgi:uncharacterized protein (UPF0332 family)
MISAADFMARAERALASARLLLDAGDADGACNRVYYAIFDAAKAALLATRAPLDVVGTKTHSGLIAAFGLQVVKRGLISVDHGRAFNRLHELRLIADYRGDSVEPDLVSQSLNEGEAFVAAVAALLAESGKGL